MDKLRIIHTDDDEMILHAMNFCIGGELQGRYPQTQWESRLIKAPTDISAVVDDIRKYTGQKIPVVVLSDFGMGTVNGGDLIHALLNASFDMQNIAVLSAFEEEDLPDMRKACLEAPIFHKVDNTPDAQAWLHNRIEILLDSANKPKPPHETVYSAGLGA